MPETGFSGNSTSRQVVDNGLLKARAIRMAEAAIIKWAGLAIVDVIPKAIVRTYLRPALLLP